MQYRASSNIVFTFLCLLFLIGSCEESCLDKQDKYRPKIHFSIADNRMGVPAALIYSEGIYHLFYLTDEEKAENNNWEHAVSANLIHWKVRHTALQSDSLCSMRPGSVVIDVKNTSGLGTSDNPPWVAIYTCTDHERIQNGDIDVQTQALAYSLDKGDTWINYPGNPVIPNSKFSNFQDPKVFWYEPEEQWVMVIVTEGKICFYSSPDLKDWTLTGQFGFDMDMTEDVWERPDLFELRVKNEEEGQWILTVNMKMGLYEEWITGYFVGIFNGKTFDTDQTMPYQIDFGNDNYSGTTFTNLPDERRVWMGWMNHRRYTASLWYNAFTIPRELHLEKTSSGYILKSLPIEERTVLYAKQTRIHDIEVKQDIRAAGIVDITSKIKFPLAPSEINVRFKPNNQWLGLGAAEKFGIRLSNHLGEYIEAGYDVFHQVFYIDRTHATASVSPETFTDIYIQPYDISESETIDIQLILDNASLELFSMNGKAVLTNLFFASSGFDKIELYAENGKVYVESISITQLKSIL